MAGYLARRALYSILVVIGVTTVVFFLIRLSGDPAILFLPPEATPDQLAALRHEYELDQPLPAQYVHYIERVARGVLHLFLDRVESRAFALSNLDRDELKEVTVVVGGGSPGTLRP